MNQFEEERNEPLMRVVCENVASFSKRKCLERRIRKEWNKEVSL
jgi:hypothetical protein